MRLVHGKLLLCSLLNRIFLPRGNDGELPDISVSTRQNANPKILVSRLLELFLCKLASPWQLQSTLYDSTAFKIIKNNFEYLHCLQVWDCSSSASRPRSYARFCLSERTLKSLATRLVIASAQDCSIESGSGIPSVRFLGLRNRTTITQVITRHQKKIKEGTRRLGFDKRHSRCPWRCSHRWDIRPQKGELRQKGELGDSVLRW